MGNQKDMTMPRLEDPPKLSSRPRPIADAIDMAKLNPSRWILAQEYGSPASARTAGSKVKARAGHSMNTRVDGTKLYIRWVG